MSEPSSIDAREFDGKLAVDQYLKNQKQTHNEWCYASINDVRKNFEARDLKSGIHYVQGDVSATLTAASKEFPHEIAVLRLDADWYDSTKIELEVLYPNLSLGGCLIIDDYGHWSGARIAVDEYFMKHKNRPFFQYIDYTGRSAIKI